ncbi:molybdopterin-guanine dinucleotide biosynthesis protein B [uncultured Methanoregula sp.]|uniref:molybdopterin-guanine dinucleotide biosynthesis protein B n=1 Tax=uncultured Methanoregula sp. TaxID=1005933 RepID=UPI002AAB2D0B|nr:molybdopterin-guanine dinucleotide biosynthesis protein B [uncultured Methanoregula sp.]
MKIIQVVGRSNSGKTTFIKNLIPELRMLGSVSVIKHLGDHDYHLEEGKDTTVFFKAGADIAVGIDATKSVVAINKNSLEDALKFLAGQGMDYTVIEGFKQYPFSKIVIGSLETEKCVLTNPTVNQVIINLELFEDYHD